MAYYLQKLDDRTLAATFIGVMSEADLSAVQQASREVIEREGSVRVLVILQHYQGFDSAADWTDIGFTAEYGDRIERIAIVGDAKWEVAALAFTGKGTRLTEIEYFPVGSFSSARAWLDRP